MNSYKLSKPAAKQLAAIYLSLIELHGEDQAETHHKVLASFLARLSASPYVGQGLAGGAFNDVGCAVT